MTRRSRPMNAIETTNLTYTYPEGSPGLRGVALTVPEGATAALIGPNGAGKSTLVLHLNGILTGEGEVRVFGIPVQSDLRTVRQMVGLVFQDPDDQLFMPTVFDDVAFGPLNLGWPEEKVEAEVMRAIRAMGLEGLERRAPHHLSIGEKKRASLATVLVMNCRLMVFDEPTAGLDPCGRRDFIELIRKLDQTKLIATHDLPLVEEMCDQVALLDDGWVVAQGTTQELLRDRQLLAAHGCLDTAAQTT